MPIVRRCPACDEFRAEMRNDGGRLVYRCACGWEQFVGLAPDPNAVVPDIYFPTVLPSP